MNAGDVKVRLIADLKNFTTNLTKATAGIKTFAGGATRAFSSLSGVAQRWARRFSIAVAGAITLSVRELAKFEEQMANVSTMLDEQAMRYMPAYERAARDLSVRFGESTATITKGLYDILSASIPPAEALGVLKASMVGAKAGMTDTGTAADAITSILNAYGYEAKYAALVSDRLFAIVKKGKLTFGEIAGSIGDVVSNASLMGIKFEVVGAAISTMTRNGVKANEAVTALNALLLGFIDPTDEAKTVAKKFGIELNSASLEGTGLLTVLQKLQGATSEDIAALTKRIRGYKALAIGVKDVTGITDDYEYAINDAGLSAKQLDKVQENLMFHLRQFWQLLIDIGREALEPFSEDMKNVIDYIVRNREAIVAWVNGVTTSLRNVLAYLGHEWQTGWRTSGKAIEAIMQATVDAVSIILEDGMIAIGRNLPKWIWKGISIGNLTSESLWKSVGQKIGLSISTGVGKALTLLPGGAGERMLENVRKTQEDLNTTQAEGLGTAGKLRAVYDNLAQTLANLTAEQKKLVDTTPFHRAEGAWKSLTDEVKYFAEVFKGADWTPGMKQLIEGAKKVGAAFKEISKQIKDVYAPTKLPEPDTKPADDANKKGKDQATKWQTMWENAAAGIDAAMEDAFVSITKNVRSATEALENMLSAMQEAITRSVFQQYMQPGINEFIGKFVGEGFGSTVEQSPTTQTGTKVSGQAVVKARGGIVPGFSLGGLVEGFKRGGLVYAQSGMFTPRGTDTVPAMLTPGEGVLDRDLTMRLRKTLQVAEPSPVASRPVNINVQAIDAQGTFQFFSKNKRMIASMLGETRSTNHPIRRG